MALMGCKPDMAASVRDVSKRRGLGCAMGRPDPLDMSTPKHLLSFPRLVAVYVVLRIYDGLHIFSMTVNCVLHHDCILSCSLCFNFHRFCF